MATCIQAVFNGCIVALYATAYVVALKCRPDVKRQRLEDVGKVSTRISWVPATVLRVLSWASYPLGVLLDYFIRDYKGGCKDRERRMRIDTWIVLCASLELVILPCVKTLPALLTRRKRPPVLIPATVVQSFIRRYTQSGTGIV